MISVTTCSNTDVKMVSDVSYLEKNRSISHSLKVYLSCVWCCALLLYRPVSHGIRRSDLVLGGGYACLQEFNFLGTFIGNVIFYQTPQSWRDESN